MYRTNLKHESCSYCKKEINLFKKHVVIRNESHAIYFCSEVCLAGMMLDLDKENESINKEINTSIFSTLLAVTTLILASILIYSSKITNHFLCH